MGLELVEIIMDIENAFGIRFVPSDFEDERVQTVGGLFDKLTEKLNSPRVPSGICIRMFVFHQLRRRLVESCAVHRNQIRPTTIISQIIPRSRRIEVWNDLADKTGLRFPPLRDYGWWVLLQFTVPPTVVYFLWKHLPSELAVVFGLVAIVVIPLAIRSCIGVCKGVASILCRPPKNCKTVRDLVEQIVSMNQGSLIGSGDVWSHESTWKRFHEIVVSTLAVSPDEVTREARWKEDLAC